MDKTNPIFAKFDQVLGKTTPTAVGSNPVQSRADEINSLGSTFAPKTTSPAPTTSAPAPTPSPYGGNPVSNLVSGVKTVAGNIAKSTQEAQFGSLNNLQKDIEGGAQALSGKPSLQNAGKAVVKAGIGTVSDLANFLLAPISGIVGGGIASPENVNALSETGPIKSMAGGNTGDAMQVAQSKIEDLAKKHPDAFKGIMDALNVAMLAVGGEKVPEAGAQFAEGVKSDVGNLTTKTSEMAKNAFETTKTLADKTQSAVENASLKPAIENAKNSILDKANESRVKEFEKAFNQSKTVNATETKFGKDSPRFAVQLEREGVDLPLSKDARGKADWSEAIGNVQKIASRDNKALGELLDSSGTSINMDKAEAQAIADAQKEFKGTAQEDALANIQKEFSAYKRQYANKGFTDTNGDFLLPSRDANEIKSDLWGKSKFSSLSSITDQTKAGSNYTAGNVFKTMIENEIGSDELVKQLNQRLGDYQSLINTMNKSNGGVVHGGFMGKMLTRGVGALAGSTHGPVGVAIGAITGDAIADALMNPNDSISRYILARAKNEVPSILDQVERQTGIYHQNVMSRPKLPEPTTMYMPPTQEGKPYTPNQRVYQGEPIAGQSTPPLKGEGEIPPTTTPEAPQKPNLEGGYIQAYKGEKDLTTKILKDLEGKSTVSKQYILDATNRGELKQVERDLTREVLDTMKGDTVDVKEFAKKLKDELLPLERLSSDLYKPTDYEFHDPEAMVEEGAFTPKYENVALPSELRGNVANYSENIYRSPVKTGAGGIHFSPYEENYFGHTRVEDMADEATRRVIEVQSDLYQKGRLERELPPDIKSGAKPIWDESMNNYKIRTKDGSFQYGTKEEIKNFLKEQKTRPQEVAKLQQYNDPTAHFRMIREEIKKAAEDGKTKLQFPTGETAMKIEGLGDNTQWFIPQNENGRLAGIQNAKPENLKVGQEISQGYDERRNQLGDSWIITDVLGDGKFKAVPKSIYENFQAGKTHLHNEESFDISGKVDTSSPIYKFYEKDVQKYLNKYEGKKVTDKKGVTWIEVPIKKEYAKQPVEAFGKIGLSPLHIGAGIGAGLAGASALSQKK